MNRIASYTVGLILALILTITAFVLVFVYTSGSANAMPHGLTLSVILVLAMVQLIVQLFFFLHLGRGKDSQWNASLFGFTFFGILVVVLASVWIMYHLNKNMTASQVNQYINDQSSF